MKKIKVLIADSNCDFMAAVKSNLESGDIGIVIGEQDGKKLPAQICAELPDIVLLSVILHSTDAIDVIEKTVISSPIKPPKFLVMSAYENDFFKEELFRYGVGGYFDLPLDYEALRIIIRDLYENGRGAGKTVASPIITMEMRVTDLILELGVPAKNKGYLFLKTALAMTAEDETLMELVTKRLYPRVAEKHGASASQVEKAIRHAVDTVWHEGNQKVLAEFFGYDDRSPRKKPVSSEFIAVISQRLRNEMLSGWSTEPKKSVYK